MDLGSDSSALESVTDNELVAPDRLENLGETETKLRNNGMCHVDKLLDTNLGGKPSSDIALSLGGSIGSSPPAATKGWGLKKWRRMGWGVGKTANSILDVDAKRDLTVSTSENGQRSDCSVSPTNDMLNVLDNASDHSPLCGDSGLEGWSLFVYRDDSENSEDHSSRSSTAASAPRVRHEIVSVVGVELSRNSVRGLSLNNLGIAVQNLGQQGKGRTGTSKKARGVKIEKENSHSSMESDPRNSNFVFTQSTNSVTNNGTQSGREANYDKEYSDDAQNSYKHLNKGARTAFSKNEAESEDISQEDLAAENSGEVKEEKDENHDVLAESMMKFHSVHEALEREVQKLRDVGKEDPLFSDDSIQPSELSNLQGHEPRSFEEVQIGENRQSFSSTSETQMMKSKQNVAHLQSKLKDAQVMLKLKEAKVFELDPTFNHGDMKSQLEEALKQRIEAVVEYLVLSETIQNLRAGPLDQIKLMVEQKNLASEQVQVMDKLVGAEIRARELKAQAEKLETRCEEILESEEVWKLQNRIRRLSSCFTIQLILLLLAVYLFVLQFSSYNLEVLPT